MYVSCAIISTVQSTSANQIDDTASSEDKSKARQSLAPAGVFLFNSFFNYSLWSLFCQCGNSKKQLVKITVIFVPELCKMVRHKLISCSFWSWISYTLLQNYTVARCFCIGATLWRSFLFSDCESALLYLVFIKICNIYEWRKMATDNYIVFTSFKTVFQE